MEAVALVRRLDAEGNAELPPDAPTDFIPPKYRVARRRVGGQLDRGLWELALALTLKERLHAGDIYLSQSRRHVFFWTMLHDEQTWAEKREKAYEEMSLPTDVEELLARLHLEFDEAAHETERTMKTNPFATIKDDKLKLKQDDALDVPDSVRELKRLLEASLPRVRIEDLLQDIELWIRVSRCFVSDQ